MPEAPGTSGMRPPGAAAGPYRTDGVYRGDRPPAPTAPGDHRPAAPGTTQPSGPALAQASVPEDRRVFAPGDGPGFVPGAGQPSGPAMPQPSASGAGPGAGAGDEAASTTGPMGTRETSGVQVRLGTRGGRGRRERARAERAADERARPDGHPGPEGPGGRSGRRAGRRAGFVAAAVVALAGLVTAGVVVTSSGREGEAGNAALGGAGGGERPNGTASVPLPEAGKAVEVGTADGSRYRIAAVTAGVSDAAMPSTQSAAPSGTSYPYIEYLLTNPKNERVLLDFPGDVFVKADLVAADARGRCMPQAGVPEDMCTPPTKSRVVKTLAGGELVAGEGGDKWMPPGSSYLVRATVTVPVDRRIDGTDLGLYIWRQLYMNDRLAKPAPFPS
ncbi:hypothetical protein AB0L25_39890 [Spirillospora sp. NPDC052242]